jgi:outer membrane biosynthesis protein TonB
LSRFVVVATFASGFALGSTGCGGASTNAASPPAGAPQTTPSATETVDASTFTGKQVRGRLPPEQIKSVVLANLSVFRECYDRARRTNAGLQGKVTVKFEIDADGVVRRSADARSDLPDIVLVQCVVDAYRTLRFPEPSGGVVTVYFPLIFNPRD